MRIPLIFSRITRRSKRSYFKFTNRERERGTVQTDGDYLKICDGILRKTKLKEVFNNLGQLNGISNKKKSIKDIKK